MTSEGEKSCISCIHYKAIKCELYGWLERQGNFDNKPCQDWEEENVDGSDG